MTDEKYNPHNPDSWTMVTLATTASLVTFFAKPMLVRAFAQIPERSTVLIDAERADVIDADIRETIDAFVHEAPRRHITVERVRWPVAGPMLLPVLSGAK